MPWGSGRGGRAAAARLAAHLYDADTGATATEYAILVGFIAVVIAVAIAAFGGALSTFYTTIVNGVASYI